MNREIESIPSYFKDLKFYYWEGIFYYNNIPCSEVSKSDIIEGNIVDHYGDRAGSFDIYNTGYIKGITICGDIFLKIGNT